MDSAARLLLMAYVDEPCRICGVLLTPEDLETAVFAGYSKEGGSRSAHGDCWALHLPKRAWAYPKDDAVPSKAPVQRL